MGDKKVPVFEHAGDRWTESEYDIISEEAAELICRLSAEMGRSPAAIATKLSILLDRGTVAKFVKLVVENRKYYS